jgi:hypothetical protein
MMLGLAMDLGQPRQGFYGLAASMVLDVAVMSSSLLGLLILIWVMISLLLFCRMNVSEVTNYEIFQQSQVTT